MSILEDANNPSDHFAISCSVTAQCFTAVTLMFQSKVNYNGSRVTVFSIRVFYLNILHICTFLWMLCFVKRSVLLTTVFLWSCSWSWV